MIRDPPRFSLSPMSLFSFSLHESLRAGVLVHAKVQGAFPKRPENWAVHSKE